MVLQPIYGALSDHIGRKWLLIAFGVLGTAFTIPLLTALRDARDAWTAFLLIAAAWAIVSGYTSINAVVKAELFPARRSRDRRRPALCAHRLHLRRHRGERGALVQVHRA